MDDLRRQRTIARAVTVDGFGYWSGRDVEVQFRPADPETGLVFLREDLPQPVRIPAIAANRVDASRRTVLQVGDARVEMVEHVLAALAGLQIDNCLIAVNAPEMPGCDGSSLAFAHQLTTAGIVEQQALRPKLTVTSPLKVGNQSACISARPLPPSVGPRLSLEFTIDYGQSSPVGRQSLALGISPETFFHQLVAARTFLLQSEAKALRQKGIALRPTTRDLLIFNDQGVVENQLRYPDECVRHKMLDFIGDLALAGCDVVGHFVAHCSGHQLNAELVNALLDTQKLEAPTGSPKDQLVPDRRFAA